MEKLELIFNCPDEAIQVMRETARWYRGQGFRVWPEEWLTAEQLITSEARPEDFCIGRLAGETVCAFILQRQDSQYWGNSPENEARYLHKLCVPRSHAHRGMTVMVVQALREYCREGGIPYLRLDTSLDEKAVRRIYLQAGFKIVDIIDYPNGRSLALYELEV